MWTSNNETFLSSEYAKVPDVPIYTANKVLRRGYGILQIERFL